MSDPRTAQPYPGAPRYFVLPEDDLPREAAWRGQRVLVLGVDGPVFGFAERSWYPEDEPAEHRMWEEFGSFYARCYSSNVLRDGEYTAVSLAAAIEITEAEFDAALTKFRAAAEEIDAVLAERDHPAPRDAIARIRRDVALAVQDG